jgi:hypothetical protein
MGAYRPYCKTLYWTCQSAATFAIFAPISCTSRFRIYRTFRISHFAYIASFVHFAFSHVSRISRIRHISRSHTVRNSRTHVSRGFRIFAHFAYFAFSRFSRFDMRYRAPPWDPSHSVRIVLSSSSKVHWCVSHFISLAFHHICLCIPIYVHLSHYVFILHHPCTFSATYSAPRPGNSLSMLTRQRIVRGFYLTSFPSLRQLVRRT